MADTYKDLTYGAANRKARAHGYDDTERFAHSRETKGNRRLKRRLRETPCPQGRCDCGWCEGNRRHADMNAKAAANAALADYERGLA